MSSVPASSSALRINDRGLVDCGAGPVVVLLHGAGVDAALWAPQVQVFSQNHRVLVPNLPGHGGVPVTAGGIRGMAEYVHAELMALGVRRYAVVGLSLGGMVALEMAARWPDQVSHLVLAESVANVTASPVVKGLAAMALRLVFLVPPKWLAKLPANMMGAVTPEAGEYVKQAIGRMTRRDAYAVMRAALEYDGRPGLARIRAKTLVMVGAKNRHTHKRARKMASGIMAARFVVVPDAAHIVNRDNPEFFNREVLDFLVSEP